MSGAGDGGAEVAVAVEDRGWRRLVAGPEALCARAARAAMAVAEAAPGEVSIVLTDDAHVARLNGRYRGRPEPTNVLAFPIGDDGAASGAPRLLGDVVLARQTVAREARAQGKTAARHLSHLVVHGVLHLLGFDHSSRAEAADMEALEVAALAVLGVADPYRAPRDVA